MIEVDDKVSYPQLPSGKNECSDYVTGIPIIYVVSECLANQISNIGNIYITGQGFKNATLLLLRTTVHKLLLIRKMVRSTLARD